MGCDKGFALSEASRVLLEAGLLLEVHPGSGKKRVSAAELNSGSIPDLIGQGVAFQGAVVDSRLLEGDQLFVALPGEHTDGLKFAPGAMAAGHWVLAGRPAAADPLNSAGSPGGALLVTDPEAALACLASTWRTKFEHPIVGVTGTNGKTTTKDFLAAMLQGAGPVCATRGNFNNKLGLPLTLLSLRGEHRFAVVEMGASAVGHIQHLAGLARPEVGIITNAGNAHLQEFGSLEAIIQGKGEILDVLPANGRAILNCDSPGYHQWLDRAPCPVESFGLEEGRHIWSWSPAGKDGLPVVTVGDQKWDVPLPGKHNGANLVAALLAARALGLDPDQITAGLDNFASSAHRSAVLAIGGRQVLDDSYNANPASMQAAAQATAALPGTGPVVAILGHMAELGPDSNELHEETGRVLSSAGIDVLLAVGPAAEGLARGFHGQDWADFTVPDVAGARDWLNRNSKPGHRILIKGSRSAGMENLVAGLKEIWTDNGAER